MTVVGIVESESNDIIEYPTRVQRGIRLVKTKVDVSIGRT